MFKWVIDGGHSYNTPGKRTIDGSMREYEFNRAVSAYCKEFALNEYEGLEIHFTHSDSRDVPLNERVAYANNIGAKCFTSIHANAAGTDWNAANGIETYVYTTRPIEAYTLALQVQRDLIKATGLKDRGVKTANFAVLKCKMTSILIECGFMTNQKEAALLKTDEYRRTVAQAIVKAHATFYGWKKKASIPYKVIIPNTAFWQAEGLVQEFEGRGFKCYGSTVKVYKPGQTPEAMDPFIFTIETDLENAKSLVIELQTRGYDRTFGEKI